MAKKKKPDDYTWVPIDDPSQVFTTYDLHAAAALIASGFELLTLDKGDPRKALFVIKREEGIEKVVDDYFADRLEGKLRGFADTLKALKNRLWS